MLTSSGCRRDEHGANTLEYVALVIVSVGVIWALSQILTSGSLSERAASAICQISQAQDCGAPGSSPRPTPGATSTSRPSGTSGASESPGFGDGTVGGGAGGGGGGSTGPMIAGNPIEDYLTGETAVPDDFAEVMGYTPEEVDTPYGTRMIRADAECSAPLTGNTGRSFDFTLPCQTHDLGYDLLRYAERVGLPHNPDARRAADQQFRDDMFGHCSETRSYFNELTCKGWANTYSVAVNANSERQHHDVP